MQCRVGPWARVPTQVRHVVTSGRAGPVRCSAPPIKTKSHPRLPTVRGAPNARVPVPGLPTTAPSGRAAPGKTLCVWCCASLLAKVGDPSMARALVSCLPSPSTV